MFIKPLTSRMNPEIMQELFEIKREFLDGNSEENTMWQFMGYKWLKSIVTLVLTSINQLTEDYEKLDPVIIDRASSTDFK